MTRASLLALALCVSLPAHADEKPLSESTIFACGYLKGFSDAFSFIGHEIKLPYNKSDCARLVKQAFPNKEPHQ